jgi:hypothetical protein
MRLSFRGPIASGRAQRLARDMTNEPRSDSEPKRKETDSDPNIRGRVEALKEKVSGLSETLIEIENTLKEGP